MLKLLEKKGLLPPLRRCPLTAGQRVSRRYRRANIRRIEYRRLKAIVPSIAARGKVTKVEVIEEAIKYIDELHKALYARVPLIHKNYPSLLNTSPQCLLAQMLRSNPSQSSSDANLTTHTTALELQRTGSQNLSSATAAVSAKQIQLNHQRFQDYLAQRAVFGQQQRQTDLGSFPSQLNFSRNNQGYIQGSLPRSSSSGVLQSMQSTTAHLNR